MAGWRLGIDATTAGFLLLPWFGWWSISGRLRSALLVALVLG